jgi:antitoxin Phd
MKTTYKAKQKPVGTWQLQTAKARFSELFRRARNEGPQIVSRQGKEQVVVLPIEQFEALTKRTNQPHSLVQFFARSPLSGSAVSFHRNRDTGRPIKL